MAYTDTFPIVKNFFETKLTADCDAGETTLFLESVENLPSILVGRDYVPLVLRDAGTVREIVYVDAVDNTAGTVTVRRGQEGTTPAAWATGTYAYCTVTSDSFQRMRVNGFAPLVTDEGRPSISRTSATTVSITGDFSTQLEVGMAVRVLSGDTVVEPTDAELGAIHVTAVSFSAGVTSVSFQNVSLPTKVDGIDLGLSVASAPLYHPDTVVADEDTLTQTQNVLSVSQKFKDDLKAELDKRDEDQATRDAEQDAAIAEAKSSADEKALSFEVDGLDLFITYGNGSTERVKLPTGKGVGDLWAGHDPKSVPANVQLYSGQLLSRAAYEAHSALVLGGKRTVVTESEWQSYASAHDGMCPYYSSGDGSTTYRMPCIKGVHPKFVAALAEAGQYVEEGLPNITGSGSGVGAYDGSTYTGAFNTDGSGSNYSIGGYNGSKSITYTFDASRSNSIYGASDTVQPPALTFLLGEYVVGSVATVGEADAESLLAGQTLLDAKVGALEGGVGRAKAYITESWVSGTSWYRKYSDGWIEQGGEVRGTATRNFQNKTVTFPKAFANTNYTIVGMTELTSEHTPGAATTATLVYNNVKTTGVIIGAYSYANYSCLCAIKWYACGF